MAVRFKRPESLMQRFLDRCIPEPNSGCWLWLGSARGTGAFQYGEFFIGARRELAHRASWQLMCGASPGEMHVCHSCDTPLCVNPEHLFLGTQADNIADMHAKGRWRRDEHLRGSTHPRAKLTEADVREMRERHSVGAGYRELAAMFGVSKSAAFDAVSGKRWAHVG